MFTFLFYVSFFLLIITLLAITIFSFLWISVGFKTKVPFISVSNLILKDIYKNLEIKDNSIVYDLGCGDGRVLLYSARQNPKAKYIGIEINLLPFFLARVGSLWEKKITKNKIEILKQDFFKKDLSDATHIFTYLFPKVMDDLLPKLEKELKLGTRLVSATFQFKNKNPIAEIELGGKKHLVRKLYVYLF